MNKVRIKQYDSVIALALLKPHLISEFKLNENVISIIRKHLINYENATRRIWKMFIKFNYISELVMHILNFKRKHLIYCFQGSDEMDRIAFDNWHVEHVSFIPDKPYTWDLTRFVPSKIPNVIHFASLGLINDPSKLFALRDKNRTDYLIRTEALTEDRLEVFNKALNKNNTTLRRQYCCNII